jgi:hypothetical protein
MLLSVGNTHLYELISTGELDSYLEGRARRITVESIQRRIARLVAENAAARLGAKKGAGHQRVTKGADRASKKPYETGLAK